MQLKLVLPLVGALILLLTLVVAGLGAARESESQPAPLRTPTVALGSAPESEPQPGPLRTATFALG